MAKLADLVDWVVKKVHRKSDSDDIQHETTSTFYTSPPTIEWHIKCPEEEWDILTLHPIEIARQLTLLEFDLFKAVKPSELLGNTWSKPDTEGEINSPNLVKFIKHTVDFTRWLEKNILETGHNEERVAVISRIIEIMIVLLDLNNFSGTLAVVGALNSSSVQRLKLTFQSVPPRLMKALEEAIELECDRHRKYEERIRTVNPPCIPFFGVWLSNLSHIQEEDPSYVHSNAETQVNFGKLRKISEIMEKIQHFQSQRYHLKVEPSIRRFLGNLNPLKDSLDADFRDYLYYKSLEIEPRNCTRQEFKEKGDKAPRRWPEQYLKSPGIKLRDQVVNSIPTTPATPVSPPSSPAQSASAGGEIKSAASPRSSPSTAKSSNLTVFAFTLRGPSASNEGSHGPSQGASSNNETTGQFSESPREVQYPLPPSYQQSTTLPSLSPGNRRKSLEDHGQSAIMKLASLNLISEQQCKDSLSKSGGASKPTTSQGTTRAADEPPPVPPPPYFQATTHPYLFASADRGTIIEEGVQTPNFPSREPLPPPLPPRRASDFSMLLRPLHEALTQPRRYSADLPSSKPKKKGISRLLSPQHLPFIDGSRSDFSSTSSVSEH